MKGIHIIGICALAAAIGSSQAASVTGYTSEADYNAAVGSQLYLIDFNGLGPTTSPGIFAGQIDFGSPESSNPGSVIFNSDAMTDSGSLIASNGVGPIGGVFASPAFAFRMLFSSSGNPQTINVYDAGSVFLGSAVSNPGGFFGVVSDTPITSFVIVNGEFSPGNRDRYFVDNFAVNAPIPEPEIYAMLAAGLGLMGFVARRRKQQAAAA